MIDLNCATSETQMSPEVNKHREPFSERPLNNLDVIPAQPQIYTAEEMSMSVMSVSPSPPPKNRARNNN